MDDYAEQTSRNTRADLVEQLDLSARKLGLLLDKLRGRMEQDDGAENTPVKRWGAF